MNFRDLLEEYHIPIAPPGHHHVSEGWVQFDCPFCSRNSGRYRMGYNIRNKYLNCWSCGGKSVVSVLQELTNLPYPQIKKILDELEIETTRKDKGFRPKSKLILPKGISDFYTCHKEYLSKRGFDPEEIKKIWGVQGIGIGGEYQWRLFIPIYYRDEMVNWTTRAIGNLNKPKYKGGTNEEVKIPKSELLYGEDYARNTIIIVEGVVDVWRIGPGAVATLGVNFSPVQFEKMIQYPKRIVCYDSDTAGQTAAKKLVNNLAVFPGETINVVLDSKDPGEAQEKEIKHLRKLL